MRYIIAAFLTLFVTQAQAQAPTRLCFSLVNGGTSNCVPVDNGNPLPISGSFSITGFSSNNNFGSLTATGSSSASTALPGGGGTAVRISNTGTTAVSCTFATGAATGLTSNIYVNAGSAVVRQVGTYDHIACIDQSGSVSNLVTLEGGSGLGNDSGGGGGSGGLSVTDAAVWTTAVSSFTPSGGVFNDAATLSSGQQGTARLTTKRATIIDVDTVGNALYTALTATGTVQGGAANGVATAGNPLQAGCVAQSLEATVLSGQAASIVCDLARKLIMLPYANPENLVSGVTAAMTGTTTTSLIAAPAAGLRNYITQLICTNSHATVGTFVVVQDGSGGTTIYEGYAAAVGGGFSLTFPAALRQPTTATAIFIADITTGANVICSGSGYKGA